MNNLSLLFLSLEYIKARTQTTNLTINFTAFFWETKNSLLTNYYYK